MHKGYSFYNDRAKRRHLHSYKFLWSLLVLVTNVRRKFRDLWKLRSRRMYMHLYERRVLPGKGKRETSDIHIRNVPLCMALPEVFCLVALILVACMAPHQHTRGLHENDELPVNNKLLCLRFGLQQYLIVTFFYSFDTAVEASRETSEWAYNVPGRNRWITTRDLPMARKSNPTPRAYDALRDQSIHSLINQRKRQ